MVFTFFLHSALSSENLESNPAMEALVQTNLALMTTSTIDLISSIVSDLVGKSILFVSTLPSQSLNIARVGAVVGFAVLFHEGYQTYLTGGDQIFRVLLGPLFQDVIFSIFQVFRLFFDAIIHCANREVEGKQDGLDVPLKQMDFKAFSAHDRSSTYTPFLDSLSIGLGVRPDNRWKRF